jgi:hypothetical protein
MASRPTFKIMVFVIQSSKHEVICYGQQPNEKVTSATHTYGFVMSKLDSTHNCGHIGLHGRKLCLDVQLVHTMAFAASRLGVFEHFNHPSPFRYFQPKMSVEIVKC